MKPNLFSNKFVLYIISTALLANLVFIIFRTVIINSKIFEFINSASILESKDIAIISMHFVIILMKIGFAFLLLLMASSNQFRNNFDESFLNKIKRTIVLALSIIFLEFFTAVLEHYLQFDTKSISLRATDTSLFYQLIILVIIFFVYKQGVSVQKENDLTI
ncbi:hypothetical protein [Chryseobacterium sp.]|uniref:hypothetical protein n=1 Tax=Chryseobacterium sp. TaxID=1871047 RepID=UPI00388E8D71